MKRLNRMLESTGSRLGHRLIDVIVSRNSFRLVQRRLVTSLGKYPYEQEPRFPPSDPPLLSTETNR